MKIKETLARLALVSVCSLVWSGCAHWAGPAGPAIDLTWEGSSPPSPPMVWVPAGHFRKSDRGPDEITAIVIHTTEGRYIEEDTFAENQARNFRGNVNFFRSNERNVSAHFVLGPNGEVVQMVNESDIAFTQTYYNGRAIGIECAGWGRRAETWTPELLEALINLTAYLCVKWEVQPYHPEGTAHEGPNRIELEDGSQRFTGEGLVGHFQVQPWNKSDPGEHFPWEEFSERVRERIREYGGDL